MQTETNKKLYKIAGTNNDNEKVVKAVYAESLLEAKWIFNKHCGGAINIHGIKPVIPLHNYHIIDGVLIWNNMRVLRLDNKYVSVDDSKLESLDNITGIGASHHHLIVQWYDPINGKHFNSLLRLTSEMKSLVRTMVG